MVEKKRKTVDPNISNHHRKPKKEDHYRLAEKSSNMTFHSSNAKQEANLVMLSIVLHTIKYGLCTHCLE